MLLINECRSWYQDANALAVASSFPDADVLAVALNAEKSKISKSTMCSEISKEKHICGSVRRVWILLAISVVGVDASLWEVEMMFSMESLRDRDFQCCATLHVALLVVRFEREDMIDFVVSGWGKGSLSYGLSGIELGSRCSSLAPNGLFLQA